MSVNSFFLLFAGGTVAGVLGTMLGLGGGVFLIPFLVLGLDVPMHQAIATSIIAVIATSSTGAAMNLEHRTVNIRLGMALETTTVLGAVLGGITAAWLNEAVLTRVFAGLLLAVAFVMMIPSKERETTAITGGLLSGAFFDESRGSVVSYAVRRLRTTMMVSLLAGNISGLLGVGGGIFKVPAMHLLSGVPMKAATATSNFMIGVTATASAFIYFAHGYVQPYLVSPSVLGVLAGSILGVRLGRSVNTALLKWLFVAILLLASIQLLLRAA